MFVIYHSIQLNDFIVDMDVAIKHLNAGANHYYRLWAEDVNNSNNSAPEANVNYSGYLFQRRRSSLMRQLKSIMLRYADNDVLCESDYLSKDELRFLTRQPEIKKIFDKYTIQILN